MREISKCKRSILENVEGVTSEYIFYRPMNFFGIISKICPQDGVKVIIKTH